MFGIVENITKTPLQRASERAAYFRALLESQQSARKALEEKRDAALEAMPEGDGRALARIRDSLHDIDLKLAETRAGLASAQRRIAEEEAKAAAAKEAELWQRIAAACERRAATAARLQAAVAEAGAATVDFDATTAALLALVPLPKPHRIGQEWHEQVTSAFERQLDARTEGTFGKEAVGVRYNTRAEFLANEPDIAAKVKRQHEQLLAQRPKEEHGDEPRAA